MASTKGNRKIAKIRGAKWREALTKGRLEAGLHPSKMKIARVQSGKSQELLSQELKISMSTLWQIERGKRLVRMERAKRIASIIGAPVNSIFSVLDKGKCIAK